MKHCALRQREGSRDDPVRLYVDVWMASDPLKNKPVTNVERLFYDLWKVTQNER